MSGLMCHVTVQACIPAPCCVLAFRSRKSLNSADRADRQALGPCCCSGRSCQHVRECHLLHNSPQTQQMTLHSSTLPYNCWGSRELAILKRSGRLKSSWMVLHCHRRPIASLMLMSILGPATPCSPSHIMRWHGMLTRLVLPVFCFSHKAADSAKGLAGVTNARPSVQLQPPPQIFIQPYAVFDSALVPLRGPTSHFKPSCSELYSWDA